MWELASEQWKELGLSTRGTNMEYQIESGSSSVMRLRGLLVAGLLFNRKVVDATLGFTDSDYANEEFKKESLFLPAKELELFANGLEKMSDEEVIASGLDLSVARMVKTMFARSSGALGRAEKARKKMSNDVAAVKSCDIRAWHPTDAERPEKHESGSVVFANALTPTEAMLQFAALWDTESYDQI